MKISAKTQLIGLLGWPVSHSKSPVMHNAAIKVLGMDWVYVALPVQPDQIEAAVRGLPALGFRGVNVTVPHKQAVMPFLDEIDPAAQAVGAVNTIVFGSADQPMMTGYNTDWSGFLADLGSYGVDVKGRGCLILGAGGSARGVAYALAHAGGRVHVFARRVAQAKEVALDIGPHFPREHMSYHEMSEVDQILPQWKAPLVINTTPVGMTPHVDASVWPDTRPFPPNTFVYDLVYNPAETKLMKQAKAAGCQAENGLGMLVHQGAQALKLWTGLEPDTAVMAAAIGERETISN